ncbi:SEC-C domain-containing protein [Henriciella aquimarina]|uniref:SEC-C domain-containing protein n=1 Tax=Henriciella aquimarina TaxID=545261 RepID=UPI0011799F2E|nr:SEC-C domain-containing protein [Henriciella aquimarina]
MANVSREVDEARAELDVQLRLLRKSCHEFDSGDSDETRNISRALRVICADDNGHNNPCLLSLAQRDNVDFIDTSFQYNPYNIAPEFGLIVAVLGPQTAGPKAFLDTYEQARNVSFSNWLNATIIDDKEGTTFSRLRLLKAMANMGGGTHFPRDLRPFFTRLREYKFTAQMTFTDKEIPLLGAADQSMRQIAHEVLKSLDPSYQRSIWVESGAMMAGKTQTILLPGRKMIMSMITRTIKNGVTIQGAPSAIRGIAPPTVKLPYEDTARNAACPCGSGIKFKKCCETAREFDADFMAEFRRSRGLSAKD